MKKIISLIIFALYLIPSLITSFSRTSEIDPRNTLYTFLKLPSIIAYVISVLITGREDGNEYIFYTVLALIYLLIFLIVLLLTKLFFKMVPKK